MGAAKNLFVSFRRMSSPPPSTVVAARQQRRPDAEEEHVGLNGMLAAWMTKKVGSMWAVYFTVTFVVGWIVLATWGPLHHVDPYPFPFLLFMGNVAQLLLVFVILVGQGVLGRSTDQRAVRTYDDAEAILRDVGELHQHLEEQDKILTQGVALFESQPHPWIEARKAVKPLRVRDVYVGVNGRIAAWITGRVSTMWAFYIATIFQFGWIGLAQVGIITFDPYPFAFLLFISSLLQLIFMFVIMVGQDVLGRASDQRAQQTLLDTEAIVHECQRLQQHLTAQDKVIVKICEYISEHSSADQGLQAP